MTTNPKLKERFEEILQQNGNSIMWGKAALELILKNMADAYYLDRENEGWVCPKISKDDRDFIVDNALNGLWNHCEEKLKGNLGDIERKNVEYARDKSKQLMKLLDPTLF